MSKKMVWLQIGALVWFVGIFFLGWKAILWTFIGAIIGILINKIKEETRV